MTAENSRTPSPPCCVSVHQLITNIKEEPSNRTKNVCRYVDVACTSQTHILGKCPDELDRQAQRDGTG